MSFNTFIQNPHFDAQNIWPVNFVFSRFLAPRSIYQIRAGPYITYVGFVWLTDQNQENQINSRML